MLVLLCMLCLPVPLPTSCCSSPERFETTNSYFLVSILGWVIRPRPGHNLGICRPMRHPCLRTALRSNDVLNEALTLNADVDTSVSPQVSSPGSVCELILTLVAQNVRSWMNRLGVHHQQRSRGTTKWTHVSLCTYRLNIDDTAVLKVWAITTFAHYI